MGVHVIVHRRPDGLKAALAKLRRAYAGRSRAAERRVTMVRVRVAFRSMVVTTPHRPWLSESEVRARRARTLLEDNPASG